jgi:hypothetical protein
MMGMEEDPEDNAAVAASVFIAVAVYAVSQLFSPNFLAWTLTGDRVSLFSVDVSAARPPNRCCFALLARQSLAIIMHHSFLLLDQHKTSTSILSVPVALVVHILIGHSSSMATCPGKPTGRYFTIIEARHCHWREFQLLRSQALRNRTVPRIQRGLALPL